MKPYDPLFAVIKILFLKYLVFVIFFLSRTSREHTKNFEKNMGGMSMFCFKMSRRLDCTSSCFGIIKILIQKEKKDLDFVIFFIFCDLSQNIIINEKN